MIILSIDLGVKTGVVVNIDGVIEHWEEVKFKNSVDFGDKVKLIIDVWKPDIVLSARPVARAQVIARQSIQIGIISYVAGKADVYYHYDFVDSSCKKVVLGNGHACKYDIEKHYTEIGSEDCRDAAMFADWYLQIKQNNV